MVAVHNLIIKITIIIIWRMTQRKHDHPYTGNDGIYIYDT